MQTVVQNVTAIRAVIICDKGEFSSGIVKIKRCKVLSIRFYPSIDSNCWFLPIN